MNAHDARMVPAALAAYGSGLAAVLGVPLLTVMAMGASLGVLGWWPRVRRWGPALMLAAVVTVVVAATAHLHLQARDSGGLGEQVDGGAISVIGDVAGQAQPVSFQTPGDTRLRVSVKATAWAPGSNLAQAQDREWKPAQARFTAFLSGSNPMPAYGDTVTLTGRLSSSRPGRDLGVMWDAQVRQVTPATGWQSAVQGLRKDFRAATAHLPDNVRGLTRGMVMGDTAVMPQSQIEAMRVTSLTHLTAVSGAHFAIVLMATAGLMRWWGWARRVRAAIAIAVMVAFTAFVLPQPSVVRALAMALAVGAALWWGRRAQALPALSAGVVVLVVLDPYLTLTFGFALSVTAVAALVCWAPVLAVWLQRRMPPAVAKAVAIPLAAQVACAPILVLFMPGIGVYGIAANLVAAVCAVPVTLVGLTGVVFGAVSMPLASMAASVAGAAAVPVAWVAHTLAGAPGSWLPWPQGWWGAAAMAVVSTVTICCSSARGASPGSRVAGALVAVTVLVAVPAGQRANAPVYAAFEDWDVVVCDVGQGHMMLVRAAPAQAVVIDVGAADHGAVACLARHGVDAIPLLILTHPHQDHDGAVGEVLEAVPVGHAWVSPAALHSDHSRARAWLESSDVDVSVPARGDTVAVGEVALDVWHPPRSSTAPMDLNDASIAVVGNSGGVTFANLGDLEMTGQREVMKSLSPHGPLDVVQMIHHGSATQHPPLVEALAARIAVAGVGADNRHGHPAASAVALYERHGTMVVRTDQCADAVVARRPQLVLSTGCRDLMAG